MTVSRILSTLAILCSAALAAGCGDSSQPGGSGGSGGGSGGTGGDGGAGGATSTTTTTGGGGAPACMPVGDACTGCEFTECPEEYCDCYGSPECVLLAACTGNCAPGDDACNQACWTAHPDAISTGALLVNCAGTVCAASCPGYQPLGDCLVCLYTDCQPQMNACVSNPECTQLLDCLAACATPQCETSCYQQHPDGAAEAGPVANCLQASCAMACQP